MLTEHFLAKFNRAKKKSVSFAPDVMRAIENYAWPGNVRELEHLIEVLIVTAQAEDITSDHLPERLRRPRAAGDVAIAEESLTDDFKAATKNMTTKFEREFILRQLEKRRWNVTQTAEAIGLSRAAMHAKMKEYGIGNA